MKKIFSTALLALAVSGFAASESFAGTFGLFYRCCGCCGCGAKFCVRQYNAFSPVCSGTVYCDGCFPFGSGCGYGAYGAGGCGYGGGGYGGCAGGMCPGMVNFSGMMGQCAPGCMGGCLGSLPATDGGMPSTTLPSEATPPASSNPIVTPSPLPGQTPSGPTSQTVNGAVLQSTSYRPMSYPLIQTQPQTMVAPSYWGN